MSLDLDQKIRIAAFDWLSSQVRSHGDVLPRQLLAMGFVWDNQNVPLVGPQGIFKPKVLPSMPLSITTSPSGPYDDQFASDGLLLYAYRGTNPLHHENVGLRQLMKSARPLIYLHRIVPGKYLPAWPAYVVGDSPAALQFKVALDDALQTSTSVAESDELDVIEPGVIGRRKYITGVYKHRLHQRAFRERVLRAYRAQCALCRLRHEELLDAAHIIPDTEDDGIPIVQNGVALCKLHHSAYDRNFLTIRPDYVIEVSQAILKESDGPMLRHGLKDIHHQRIRLPRQIRLRPDPARLERRYREFQG